MYATRAGVVDELAVNRLSRMCSATHMVGDSFSILMTFPCEVTQHEEFKALLTTPGVFCLTMDNCLYGMSTRSRVQLVTNAAWLVTLSRDCTWDGEHPRTATVQHLLPRAPKFAQAFAKQLQEFTLSAKDEVCSHCASAHGAQSCQTTKSVDVRTELKTQLRRFFTFVQSDQSDTDEVLAADETYENLEFTAQSEAVLSCSVSVQPGARSDSAPSKNFPDCPEKISEVEQGAPTQPIKSRGFLDKNNPEVWSREAQPDRHQAVSYTHLTLPTKA